MVPEFYLFSLLPAELRLQIWEAAIRDRETAGVQFLDVRTHRGRRFGGLKPLLEATVFLGEFPMPYAFELGLHGSRSTYCIDSGLWDACLESKRVMQRAFGRIVVPESSPVNLLRGIPWHPSTLPFQDSTCTTRHLTYFPFDDLIVLPQDAFFNAMGLRLFRRQRPIHHKNLRQIAVEYSQKPVLVPMRHGQPLYRHWERALMRCGPETTVYLIDNQLERRKSLATSRRCSHRKTFIANGGRYVEVDDESEWEYPDKGMCVSVRKPFPVIKMINDWAEEIMKDRLEDGGLPARVALLAWEPM